MQMCYLAGAIDTILPEHAQGWRKKAANVLNAYGIHAYDPSVGFSLCRTNNEDWLSKSKVIIDVNNLVIQNSEYVLAEMEFDCQHTGTVLEIKMASEMGKVVVVWNSNKFTPMYLHNIQNIHIFPTLSQCVNYIVEHSKGKTIHKQDAELLDSAGREEKYEKTLFIKLLDGHPLKKAQEKGELGDIDPRLILFKKYGDDTGFDIICSENLTIPPYGKANVPTHIALQPPKGYWYRLVGRSSTFHVHGMLVVEGIIDTQYRGHLYCSIQNVTGEEQHIRAGDALAQLVFHEVVGHDWNLAIVDELKESERGTNGFGSTTASRKNISELYQKYSQ